jgi:hypothetical protein
MSSYANPAVGAEALTGSAQTASKVGRGLLITATGNIVFVTSGGDSITWSSIPVGVYPITVKSITSCTASGYILL